jgi:MoxR-like ATPase
MDGTYSLPEAQIDRFLFKLLVRPPDVDQIEEILDRTTEETQVAIRTITDGARIMEMGELVRKVPIASEIRRFGVLLVAATHPQSDRAPEMVRRYVQHGSSPRGAQALVLGSKIRAILDGRYNVSAADLRAVAPAALRHRVILNYEGQAEAIQPDALIRSILDSVPDPGGGGP